MTKVEEKIERVTCRKLTKLMKKAPTVSEAVAMYERAYTRYRAMVLGGDGSKSSGALLYDHVAYVNAIARYAATRGVMLKEIS